MKKSLLPLIAICTPGLLNGCGAASPPPPLVTTHFSVTSGSNTTTAGAAFNFTVTALDASNTRVSTYTGTVQFISSDNQAVLPANSALTNGTGTFSATLKTAGNQTITATDTASPSITSTPTSATVSAAAPSQLSVTAPATVNAGTAFNFTVTAQDQFSNTATTYSGTVHFTSSDAQAALPANAKLTTGTGTFSATFNTAANQTITASDTVTASITGTAAVTVPPVGISVSPASDTLGPAGKRIFVAAVSGTSNTAVTWSVEEGAVGGMVDVNGNYTAPTTQGTFHLAGTSVADPAKSASATVTVVPSGFLPAGTMTTPRYSHTATLLNTGKALLAGGIASKNFIYRGIYSFCSGVSTDHAELFDPTNGTFAPTGSMTALRSGHASTLLPSGKVLVTGGNLGSTGTAEVFDPATAAFTATANMISLRSLHTATLLPSGKVLIAGGSGAGTSAELFDPAMDVFAATGSMTGPRYSHTATLLQSGKVLVAGGQDSNGSASAVSTAELYDPASGAFSPTGSMGTARQSHTTTLLANGSVLIAGGFDQNGAPLSTAEVYNPITGMFATTISMLAPHFQHTASLLPSGNVLIAGGGGFVAELFDPGTGTFSLTGSLFMSRRLHAATLLPNGEVLVTGSQTPVHISNSVCMGGVDASAELYH